MIARYVTGFWNRFFFFYQISHVLQIYKYMHESTCIVEISSATSTPTVLWYLTITDASIFHVGHCLPVLHCYFVWFMLMVSFLFATKWMPGDERSISLFPCGIARSKSDDVTMPVPWTLYYCSDLTLSQSFQRMAAHLSIKFSPLSRPIS